MEACLSIDASVYLRGSSIWQKRGCNWLEPDTNSTFGSLNFIDKPLLTVISWL